jgi:hypothetical protein
MDGREQVLVPGKYLQVTFGQENPVTYDVKPLAFGPLKRAKKVFIEAVNEFLAQVLQLQENASVTEDNVNEIILDIGKVFDLIADKLPNVYAVFLPGVNKKAVFEGEDGATIPQLIDAAQAIAKANGFDRLPNLLRQVMTLKS